MKIPHITWSQNNLYVFININVTPQDGVIELNDNVLSFNQDDYHFKFELFDNIKDIKIRKNRIFEIYLIKNDITEWSRITKNKNEYKNHINIDWSKYDYDDNEPQQSNEDFLKQLEELEPEVEETDE